MSYNRQDQVFRQDRRGDGTSRHPQRDKSTVQGRTQQREGGSLVSVLQGLSPHKSSAAVIRAYPATRTYIATMVLAITLLAITACGGPTHAAASTSSPTSSVQTRLEGVWKQIEADKPGTQKSLCTSYIVREDPTTRAVQRASRKNGEIDTATIKEFLDGKCYKRS